MLTIEAAHDGYRQLPGRPIHRRRWLLTEAGLRVEDYVTGRGQHALVLRWHLAPGAGLRLAGAGAVVTTPAGEFRVIVSATGPMTLAAETGQVAEGFARTVEAPVLVCRVSTGCRCRSARAGSRSAGPGSRRPRARGRERRDTDRGDQVKQNYRGLGQCPDHASRHAPTSWRP